MNQNSNKKSKKTIVLQEFLIKKHFETKVIEWKKSIIKVKKIICKICLKMFTYEANWDFFEIHSMKCKEMAELDQSLGQMSKKLKKYKLECELMRREIQLETNVDK